MIIFDISNKHKRKYIAFAVAVNMEEHIIAGDTIGKLVRFFEENWYSFEDYYIFNRKGRLIQASIYNPNFIRDNAPVFLKTF